MATQTTNYGLIKPDYSDPVDVDVLNDNADLIDAALTDKANLVNGKVPASELPSYVDDVIEGYYYNGAFYEDSAHTTPITGESGKIYVDLSTNVSYRWSGSAYIPVGNIDEVTDDEMITICSVFADFITDGTNIIGVDSTTALAF